MSTDIWIVDDDSSIRWVLSRALSNAGWQTESFDSAEAVLQALQRKTPSLLISDIRMPGMSGLELLSQIQQQQPQLPMIIMTAHSDLDSAVTAYQSGAFEYLPKPFDVDDAVALVQRALQVAKEQRKQTLESADAVTEMIGEAPAMQDVFRAIGRLSRSTISVLINGESGAGKELVARALHRHSPRADKPFIALNMAAIPKDLIESELFGHEKGAFTGANSVRQGRFEQAHGGTLFLDEIGDMPLDVQTRLLRVLADGQFYRVGAHAPMKVDVRIIAATHQNLEERVAKGDFREDLFHRLNVIRIALPALRERKEDIPQLSRHFLTLAAREIGGEVKVISSAAMALLQQYHWPGNVRQLENVCRWLTVMACGQEVLPADLPAEVLQQPSVATTATAVITPPVKDASHSSEPPFTDDVWPELLQRWAEQALQRGDIGLINDAVPTVERVLLQSALNHTRGHKQEAARLLGWGRNTLTRKLKELGMLDARYW